MQGHHTTVSVFEISNLCIALAILFQVPPGSCVKREKTILEHVTKEWDNSRLSRDAEQKTLKVTAKTKVANGNFSAFSLNNKNDFYQFQSALAKSSESIQILIERSGHLVVELNLRRNSHNIITKNFITRYYTTSGKPVTQKAGLNNYFKSFCNFIGTVSGDITSVSSLNICGGIRGVIKTTNYTFLLETLPTKSEFWYQFVLKNGAKSSPWNCKVDSMILPEDDKRTARRKVRQIQLPADHKATTRYIEMYVVMDHTIYVRTGSLEGTIQRALDIVHHASMLYRQMDIYIALVGVEVWNDEDKITFPLYKGQPGIYDYVKTKKEFSKYRLYNINKHTVNDNAQLFFGVKNDHDGQAALAHICTRTRSAGVTNDILIDDIASPAVLMAHELGHTLGFTHSDKITRADPNKRERCECKKEDGVTFDYCILNGNLREYL